MVSYILITGYSILLFMNPLNFKFLQVPTHIPQLPKAKERNKKLLHSSE